MWQFSKISGYDSTHFLYMYRYKVRYMLPPYTLQVWGIVSFIEIGFATTFKLIFEIISTLSFYILIHRKRRCYGNKS